MKRKIEVVRYDAGWPERYEREADGLRIVFGPSVISVDHIGSTAIPGMRAKPTIDILVVVNPATEIPSFDRHMEDLGYVCRGEGLDAVIPGTHGRFYYVRKSGVDHLTHVHVCAEGHSEVHELLVLRDYLRTHSAQAESYGREKAKLSDQFAYDNIGYMKGKDAYVKALIRDAIEWHAWQS